MSTRREFEHAKSAMTAVLEEFCSPFERRDADAVMRLVGPYPALIVVTSEEAILRGPGELEAFLRRYEQGATTYSWDLGTLRRRDVRACRVAASAGLGDRSDRQPRQTPRLPHDDGLRTARRAVDPRANTRLVAAPNVILAKRGEDVRSTGIDNCSSTSRFLPTPRPSAPRPQGRERSSLGR